MKRGTPRHPKVYDLAERLGCDRPAALGYLELLWHFTAEMAPQGDIGRFSDKRIEAALDWNGRGKKPGKLIEALVSCGWVDRNPEFAECKDAETECNDHVRLAVHDWKDHCDESVRKRLARAGLQFVEVAADLSGQRRDVIATTSASVADSGSLPLPLPLPLPEPMPMPEPDPEPDPEPSLASAASPPRAFSPPPIEGLHREDPPPSVALLRQQIGFVSAAKGLNQPATRDRPELEHRDTDHAWFRDELRRYPGSQRLPPAVLENGPDDAIVKACMKLCDGDRERFAAALLGMHRASKTPQLSWAWFPPVLAQYMPRVVR